MFRLTFAILTILVAYVGFTSYTNRSTMTNLIEQGKEIIQKEYELEQVDIGDFKKVMVYYILPFYSEVYKIDTLGIVSIMTMNVGMMEMLTFNINPYYKDLPQLTIEYMITFNTRKFYIDIYDFMINKEAEDYKDFIKKIEELNTKYSVLDDITSDENWYDKYLAANVKKSGSILQDKKMMNIFSDIISYYIEYAKNAKELSQSDAKTKYDLTKDFCDKLVENGGVAINNFKKSLGDDKTKEFLGNVLYGYLHIEV